MRRARRPCAAGSARLEPPVALSEAPKRLYFVILSEAPKRLYFVILSEAPKRLYFVILSEASVSERSRRISQAARREILRLRR